MDLMAIFAGMAAMTGAVVALAEFIDKFWDLEGTAAQLRSLAIGILLGMAGAGFHLGMFADPSWQGGQAWYVVGGATGILSGLVGNWTFATPFIQWLLGVLHISPASKVLARKQRAQ